jgi:hypothetical protein
MRFTFTPTAIYENYLDDAHGERPQKRIIPLVGQMPNNESVDVDFADPRGKMFDRTRFDFTVTRAHNFSAGEYSVTVHRGDGVQVGTAQTLRFLGDNPVIDRRAISFVSSSGKKDKDKDKAATATDNATASADTKPAAGGGADQNHGAAAERPPPREAAGRRAGQRSGSSRESRAELEGVWLPRDRPECLGPVQFVGHRARGLRIWRLRRRRTSVCPSPVAVEEQGETIDGAADDRPEEGAAPRPARGDAPRAERR